MSALDPTATARRRRPLFYKYFIALFVAVVVPLLANARARRGSAIAISV